MLSKLPLRVTFRQDLFMRENVDLTLVVRLEKNYRTDITDVHNIVLIQPQGNQIP